MRGVTVMQISDPQQEAVAKYVLLERKEQTGGGREISHINTYIQTDRQTHKYTYKFLNQKGPLNVQQNERKVTHT